LKLLFARVKSVPQVTHLRYLYDCKIKWWGFFVEITLCPQKTDSTKNLKKDAKKVKKTLLFSVIKLL
jgi:hypothetical protein